MSNPDFVFKTSGKISHSKGDPLPEIDVNIEIDNLQQFILLMAYIIVTWLLQINFKSLGIDGGNNEEEPGNPLDHCFGINFLSFFLLQRI
jgi:hypothetical protein